MSPIFIAPIPFSSAKDPSLAHAPLLLPAASLHSSELPVTATSRLGGDIMAKTDTKLETIETLNKPGTMPWSTRLELGPMLLAFKVHHRPYTAVLCSIRYGLRAAKARYSASWGVGTWVIGR